MMKRLLFLMLLAPLAFGQTIDTVRTTDTPNQGRLRWNQSVGHIAPVFNVKSAPFNAVGDGVTDDQAAIQMAVDSAAATGGKVIVPAFTFAVNSTIHISSNVTIEGNGVGSKIFLKANFADTLFASYSASDITIRGLEIDGNRLNQVGISRVLVATGGSRISIVDNYIHDVHDDPIWLTNCTGDLIISGNRMANVCSTNTNQSAILVNRNTISGSTDGVIINNNQIDNSASGSGGIKVQVFDEADGGASSSTSEITNVVVSGNTVIVGDPGASIDAIGIELWSRNGARVVNSTVVSNVVRSESYSPVGKVFGLSIVTDNGSVVGNSIRDCNNSGMEFSGNGIEVSANSVRHSGMVVVDGGSSGITLSSNTIDSSVSPYGALTLDPQNGNFVGIHFKNNTVNAPQHAGFIIIATDTATVKDLSLEGNHFYSTVDPSFDFGTTTTLYGVRVLGNEINQREAASGGQHGIVLGAQFFGFEIARNKFHNIKGHGISILSRNSKDLFVSDNTIDSVGLQGVIVAAPISGANFSGNSVRAAGNYGYQIADSMGNYYFAPDNVAAHCTYGPFNQIVMPTDTVNYGYMPAFPLVFTPSEIGWYRIINSTAGQIGGRITISAGLYDNTFTDLEFQFSVAGYGIGGSIQQTRYSSYNDGVVDSLRITSDSVSTGRVFLDVHVRSITTPSPITIAGFGDRLTFFATTPDTVLMESSAWTRTLVVGHGFRTTSISNSDSSYARVANSNSLYTVGDAFVGGDITASNTVSITWNWGAFASSTRVAIYLPGTTTSDKFLVSWQPVSDTTRVGALALWCYTKTDSLIVRTDSTCSTQFTYIGPK